MNIFEFTQFDEGRFPAVCDPAGYRLRVGRGYSQMRRSSVVIAGLARNVAHILPATILRIERLAACFASADVVIYENDSSDHTTELLAAWQSVNPRLHLITETLAAPVNRPIRCSSRARWMVYYRSCIHQYVVRELPASDCVILLDTDLVGGWSLDGIADTFGRDGWDFVGSNGMIYRRQSLRANHLAHYDAWAYRLDAAMTPISTCDVNTIQHRRGEPLVPLTSCFGGLGVYRSDAFRAGEYVGEDIEHVGFHRSLLNAGRNRLFMNPSQIVIYGRKHRRVDPYVRRAQRGPLARRLFRTEPWQFDRRVDFSHWGRAELLQMLHNVRPAAASSGGRSTAA